MKPFPDRNRATECCYIVSPDNAPMPMVCAEPIAVRAYCARHARLCYQPFAPRGAEKAQKRH